MFHRFVQPNYFGASVLPAGPASVTFNGVQYNLINVVSGGVGIPDDSAAFADTAKAAGPNEGTYFVAFGEDAKSINANRGLAALARNTDVLDDWFHRDLALPVRTNLATSAGAASLILPAQTFVGASGGFPLALLFSVVNDMDAEILNGTDKVAITSITGATVGSGFSAGLVTLNLNVPIPNGVSYRILYSTRSNLATLPTEALLTPTPFSDEASTLIQQVIQNIKGENIDGDHGEPAALDTLWDNFPLFTLRGLGANGLDGMYRRNTILAPVYEGSRVVFADSVNTPGSGATILLDGPSILAKTQPLPGVHYDAAGAMFWGRDGSAAATDNPRFPFVGTSTITKGIGGLAYNLVGDGAGSSTRTNLALGTDGPNNTVTGTLQSIGTHFFEFNLTSGQHFTGADGTRIVVGRDILVLRLDDTVNGQATPGSVDVPFRIVGVRTATKLNLTTLDGSPFPFLIANATAVATPVTAGYWLRHSAEVSNAWLWNTRDRYPAFVTEYDALVTGGMATVNWGGSSLSIVAQQGPVAPTPLTLPTAGIFSREVLNGVSLEWGYVQDATGILQTRGQLRRDGSIYGTDLSLTGDAAIDGQITLGGGIYSGGDASIAGSLEVADFASFDSVVLFRRESYIASSTAAVRIDFTGATALTNVVLEIPASSGYRTVHIRVNRASTADVLLSTNFTGAWSVGDRINIVVTDNIPGQSNYLLTVHNSFAAPFTTVTRQYIRFEASALAYAYRTANAEFVCVGFDYTTGASLLALVAPATIELVYGRRQASPTTNPPALDVSTSVNTTFVLS